MPLHTKPPINNQSRPQQGTATQPETAVIIPGNVVVKKITIKPIMGKGK